MGHAAVTLTEKSNCPWDGKINIKLSLGETSSFTLKLRIPAWAEGTAKAFVNGKSVKIKGALQKGYLATDRT